MVWSKRVSSAALLLVGLVALSGATAASAATEEPERHPSLRAMDKSMIKARGNIRNGRQRYSNGIIGVGSEAAVGTPTPARACCSVNLERIAQAVDELEQIFEGLGACYDAAGDAASRSSIDLARIDLGNLSRARDDFENATDGTQVNAALGALTRSFLQLSEDTGTLPGCGTGEPLKKNKRRR